MRGVSASNGGTQTGDCAAPSVAQARVLSGVNGLSPDHMTPVSARSRQAFGLFAMLGIGALIIIGVIVLIALWALNS